MARKNEVCVTCECGDLSLVECEECGALICASCRIVCTNCHGFLCCECAEKNSNGDFVCPDCK